MPRNNRIIPELTPQDIARFWKRVDCSPGQGPKGDCWLNSHQRHGMFVLGGRKFGRHRVAYFLATGINPCELDVCHHCDEPRCVNPAHLFLGTHADNRRDSAIKGRAAKKLNANRVLEIRELIAQGHSHRKIGKMFGVGHTEVWFIRHRKHWKDI